MIRFLVTVFFIFISIILQGQLNSSRIKVYWDVSLSMEKRDLEKEQIFLDKYVKDNKVESIILVQFSNGIKNTKEFTLVDGNTSSIATYLSEIAYDGISDMDFLLEEDSNIPSILFTDGYPLLKDVKLHYGKSKMDVVCGTANCNPILERLSLYSIGAYQELVPQTKVGKRTSIHTDAAVISGVVSDANGPLEDVAVVIKNTTKGTLTAADGSFAIKISLGDSLVFQFLGKRTVIQAIRRTSRFLEVSLEDVIENLDEVVLVQKEKIKWLPKEQVLGYGGMQTVEKEDLTVSSGSLNESLAGKFAGVQTNKDGFERSIIRGFSSIESSNFPLIIIDGAPMPRPEFQGSRNVSTDVMNMVNPNDVVSVKVLRGLAAANRYGSEGANGVILIQTRYGDVKLSGSSTSATVDDGRIRGNNFQGELKVVPEDLDNPFLKKIGTQVSEKESYNIYLKERIGYGDDPYYFINVHNAFRESNPVLAEGILNSGLAVAGNRIPALRTIAFYHQKAARYNQAEAIYDRIVQLDSSSIQPYRDLANVQVQSGKYKEGLKRYLSMVKPYFQPIVAPKAVSDIIDLELKNLIYRKGKELNLARVPSKYKSSPRYDARVVLEWNNPESEFEVEFISPFKRISKWSHTVANNQDRMEDELRYGFNLEQSLLSQVQKGDWYLNIRSMNSKDSEPLFLKCTVYYYYGQAGQYAVQEVFPFNLGNKERIVTKITIK